VPSVTRDTAIITEPSFPKGKKRVAGSNDHLNFGA
jgi:hypothetical protein